MKLEVLDPNNPSQLFPATNTALTEPNGLLAAGGCLSPIRLINAYRQGIFPWYSDDEPILWWSPNPRLVITPAQVKISRSLAKTMRQQKFAFKLDAAFAEVITACAQPRSYAKSTWITDEIKLAYNALHKLGFAHSAEAWYQDELVGGLYGVAIGQVFFGESMFHIKTDASKVAFAHLSQHLHAWGYRLIDCQIYSPHLASFGAEEITRDAFTQHLTTYCSQLPHTNAWKHKL